MRIVGGEMRGRKLAPPKTDTIRPTTDRARESLFNVLTHNPDISFDGARVIDLFAGTGALGFEALSRGASFALFVDNGVEARGLIRQNMESLKQNGTAKIFRRDATKLGPVGTMLPFDVAFLDPPYRQGLGEKTLSSLADGGWLTPSAHVIFEEASDVAVDIPPHFTQITCKNYSQSAVRLLKFMG